MNEWMNEWIIVFTLQWRLEHEQFQASLFRLEMSHSHDEVVRFSLYKNNNPNSFQVTKNNTINNNNKPNKKIQKNNE
jgi:hypothetical protein